MWRNFVTRRPSQTSGVRGTAGSSAVIRALSDGIHDNLLCVVGIFHIVKQGCPRAHLIENVTRHCHVGHIEMDVGCSQHECPQRAVKHGALFGHFVLLECDGVSSHTFQQQRLTAAVVQVSTALQQPEHQSFPRFCYECQPRVKRWAANCSIESNQTTQCQLHLDSVRGTDSSIQRAHKVPFVALARVAHAVCWFYAVCIAVTVGFPAAALISASRDATVVELVEHGRWECSLAEPSCVKSQGCQHF